MTVSEILYEHESRRPMSKGDYAGTLTQGTLDEISEESKQLREYLRKMKNEPEATPR